VATTSNIGRFSTFVQPHMPKIH